MNENNNQEELICRICHGGKEEGKLFSPCKCSGSIKFVHEKCLEKWRELSNNPQSYLRCETCKYEYNLYRPKIAKYLQSEKVISTLAIATMSAITIGSGSTVLFISGENWELKSAAIYGFVCVGLYGIAPKLPEIVRDLITIHWYKLLDGDILIPTGIALLAVGVFSSFTVIYQKIRLASKYLTKKLGERVLEVQ